MAEMATDFPSKKVDTWAQRLHRQSHVVLPELFPSLVRVFIVLSTARL